MAQIVGVHGIGQQVKGPHTLRESWLPAMWDGLRLARAVVPAAEDLACAFYGDLFRRSGKGVGEPPYGARDVQEGFEQEILDAWWSGAAEAEETVPGPGAKTKVRTPDGVQRALNALSKSAFFAGLAERVLIGSIKQVHRYFAEPALRAQVLERVAAEIGPDTRVLIGHSLGSVVAYESLCAHPDWPVRTLVTLGSPLGIRNLIFDQLCPAPLDGVGAWPRGAVRWTNIADHGDVVALVKELRPWFAGQIEDLSIHNGAKAHDVSPYLTAKETGRAIAAGLAD